MKNKNILVCVSGLTPQIVTETLFCLSVKEKILIDEIYVITTRRGRDVILGLDKHPATPKTALKTEISNLCKKYKLRIPLFNNNDKHIIVAREESIELSDIRSDKDNILFPNKVSLFLRDKTSNAGDIIFCSITGGRKSMSVHIANALSLFARERDRLLHVLTSEKYEFKGFYPLNKKEAAALQLSDIPFVRLRAILSYEIKGKNLMELNFDQIVSFTQNRLKVLSDQNKLICDIGKRELSYGNNSINLEPMEFLFYYFFVDQKTKQKNKISIYDITSPDTTSQFTGYLESYYPYYYLRENQKKSWQKGFDARDFRSKRTKINKKILQLITDYEIAMQFIIEVEKVYGESKYFIPIPLGRIKILFPQI
ncbi:MAG: TIGR02584 family CRISPR-associated protein [Ignavibacteriales bacterium CG_4_9_14_3_um_filter_30_11]|nr:MAG: TIGR02584 family CRISPR-associated protein [Ignavibacteriales bacterium CG_4_9_14_3_um_filter_30_11]